MEQALLRGVGHVCGRGFRAIRVFKGEFVQDGEGLFAIFDGAVVVAELRMCKFETRNTNINIPWSLQ